MLSFSQVGTSQGFFDLKLGLFWECIYVVQHLQYTRMHPCAYLLENVPPLRDARSTILAGW